MSSSVSAMGPEVLPIVTLKGTVSSGVVFNGDPVSPDPDVDGARPCQRGRAPPVAQPRCRGPRVLEAGLQVHPPALAHASGRGPDAVRSEERRVGKECSS